MDDRADSVRTEQRTTERDAVELAGLARRQLIGGEELGSRQSFSDYSPIDNGLIAEIARGDQTDVDAAVRAAIAAYPAWAALGPRGRGQLLDRLAASILKHNGGPGRPETLDNGSLFLGNPKRVIKRPSASGARRDVPYRRPPADCRRPAATAARRAGTSRSEI